MILRVLSAIILLSIAVLVGSSVQAQPTMPNVIIFVTDDMGWGDISPYNSNVTWTPNIQRLADEGTTYTKFYTPMAVCTPFRYALFTGLHPTNDDYTDGVIQQPNDPRVIPLERVTMADYFEDLGYEHRALIGKWHLNGNVNTATHGPTQQGYNWRRGAGQHPITGGPLPTLPAPLEDIPINLTIGAVHFLNNVVQPGENYFMQVAYHTPHIPVFSEFEGITGAGLYADSMYEIDWSIGEIVRHVDLDNTIVFFFADNGPYAPDHDSQGNPIPTTGWLNHPYANYYGQEYLRSDHWYGGITDNDFGVAFRQPERDSSGTVTFNPCKSSHWECGVKIAAISRWPGQTGGIVDNDPHQIMDVYATLENELSGQIVHAVDGVDFRTTPASPIEIYTQGSVHRATITDGRWKQHHVEGAMYDLDVDPGESNNLLVQAYLPVLVPQSPVPRPTATNVPR